MTKKSSILTPLLVVALVAGLFYFGSGHQLGVVSIGASQTFFTDGFDDGSFSAWSGSWRSSSTAVTHEATNSKSFSGGYSYHAASTTTSTVGARVYKSISLTAPDFYYSGQYFITSAFTADSQYLEVVKFASASGDMASVSVRRVGGVNVWRLTFLPSYTVANGGSAVTGSWVDVGVHVSVGESGSIELYVNGALSCTLSGINTTGLNLVYAGLVWKSSGVGATDLYMDSCEFGTNTPSSPTATPYNPNPTPTATPDPETGISPTETPTTNPDGTTPTPAVIIGGDEDSTNTSGGFTVLAAIFVVALLSILILRNTKKIK